jgi:APA family basic amino acid/polyamine antiporter
VVIDEGAGEAELASSIPIAGSAYTYSYATLGEVVAWIIGWDLVLEYGISVAAVAVGWGANLNSFLDTAFGSPSPSSTPPRPTRRWTPPPCWPNAPGRGCGWSA